MASDKSVENSGRRMMLTLSSIFKDSYTFLTSRNPVQEEPRNFEEAKISSDSTQRFEAKGPIEEEFDSIT